MAFIKCLLLLINFLLIHSMEHEHSEIYMKKSKIDDQESSASGFIYQINSKEPPTLKYSSFAAGDLNNFGYPPVTLGRFSAQLPVELPLAAIKQFPAEVTAAAAIPTAPINSYGYPATVPAYSLPELRKALELNTPLGTPVGFIQQDNSKQSSATAEGRGTNYANAETSRHGEAGDSGYKNHQQYEKGTKGQHENEQHKSFYNKEGGNKLAGHDSGAHYNFNEAKAEGSKGASFKQSNSHKKGSKTTGFHNVYHKDEYKKDHSFYDESDRNGHFNKYGDFKGNQANAQGGFVKGGHENNGFKNQQYAAKGFTDKGRFLDNVAGFKAAQGKDSYYNDENEYKKKQAQQNEQNDGYEQINKLLY